MEVVVMTDDGGCRDYGLSMKLDGEFMVIHGLTKWGACLKFEDFGDSTVLLTDDLRYLGLDLDLDLHFVDALLRGEGPWSLHLNWATRLAAMILASLGCYFFYF